MTKPVERPDAQRKLPKELESFVDESIDSMTEGELRAWTRDANKIMAGSQRSKVRPRGHSPVVAALRETSR